MTQPQADFLIENPFYPIVLTLVFKESRLYPWRHNKAQLVKQYKRSSQFESWLLVSILTAAVWNKKINLAENILVPFYVVHLLFIILSHIIRDRKQTSTPNEAKHWNWIFLCRRWLNVLLKVIPKMFASSVLRKEWYFETETFGAGPKLESETEC